MLMLMALSWLWMWLHLTSVGVGDCRGMKLTLMKDNRHLVCGQKRGVGCVTALARGPAPPPLLGPSLTHRDGEDEVVRPRGVDLVLGEVVEEGPHDPCLPLASLARQNHNKNQQQIYTSSSSRGWAGSLLLLASFTCLPGGWLGTGAGSGTPESQKGAAGKIRRHHSDRKSKSKSKSNWWR